MTIRGPARAGAALILAIILLAGLLLLGLPFLFSQSASLAGTRSLAYQQQASVGRDAAEQLGLGVAAESVRERFLVDGNAASSTLLAAGAVPIEQLTPNSYAVELAATPLTYNAGTANARLLGSIIADEQGKLDVNHLDVAAWHRLLAAVGIQDWDDNAVLDSEDPPSAVDDDDANDDDGVNGLLNGDNDDADDFGQLAKALAELRFSLPGQRITALDQLLRADTGHSTAAQVTPGDYTANAPPSGSYGFRRPLTRAELDLLRPYLTVHVLPQGRLGLIDLGSTIATHPNHGGSYFDSDISDVVRPGTILAWDNQSPAQPIANPPITYGVYNAFANLTAASGIYLQGAVMSVSNPGYVANRGFAIAAPPAVNLHHALTPVRSALGSVDELLGQVPRYRDLVSGSATSPYEFLDPLRTGRELPPIDIASFGVVQIDSAAVANDPQSRTAAQRRRRVYAQALPHESALERHWSTQDQLHALVVGRYGSRLDTWPKPVQRVLALRPDETVHDPAVATPPGAAPIGLRPRTLPSLATGWNHRRDLTPAQRRPSHLDVDWKLALGADGPTAAGDVVQALTAGQLDPLASASPGAALDVSDLRPDGIHVQPGKPIGAILRMEGNGNIPGPLRSVSPTVGDLRARHLSFWIKPDADFADETKIYPLLEARIPAGSAGARMDGAIGFSELQNYLGLFYDRKQRLLALVLAPPSIEHVADSALRVPADDIATTFDIDERCLGGNNAWLPLAPRMPYPDSSGAPLNPWAENSAKYTTAATRLLKPNRVVHLYKVADDASGRPFFRSERWCQIQVVLGGDRPGMAKLLVDGVAGRDVSRTPPTSVGVMEHGDHLALPSMTLTTSMKSGTGTAVPGIPMVAVDPAAGGAGGPSLGPIDITVLPVLGLHASDLFPARGMLRIDDEYFSYESIQLDTFKNCIRGQRQNTHTNASDTAQRWPNTQQHLPGAMVCQGGYRLNLNQGRLLRGGNTLKEGLKNGDPSTASPYRWRIWARPRTSDTGIFVPSMTNPALVIWQGLTSDTIPLETGAGAGVPDQFPATGGVILFENRVFKYTANTGSELQGITAMTGYESSPSQIFPARTNIDNVNKLSPDPIRLLSIEVDVSVNAFEPGRYETTPGYRTEVPNPTTPVQDAFLLQLSHPGGPTGGVGRVEWIAYQYLLRWPDGRTFFVNDYGWTPLTRGLQRTDFRGRANTHLTDTDVFPSGTSAIPVQCELGGQGHWFATGDVVTLRRRADAPILPGQKPTQMLVRYAAMDGYDNAGGLVQFDTKNQFFAFDRPIPTTVVNDQPTAPADPLIDASKYEILCGNCWSGRDLTPLVPINQPRGNLPRLDLFAGTSRPATLFIGATDRVSFEAELAAQAAATAPSIAMTTADAYLNARELELSATIDAVVAGRLPGIVDTADTAGVGIRRGMSAGGGDLFTGLGAIDQQLEATVGIFDQPMGLVAFDGEVFAYRRVSDTQAVIVGTGLLDRFPALGLVHAFPDGPPVGGSPARPVLPALPLPIGPVTMVGDAMTDHTWFRFVTESPVVATTSGVQLDAPAVLICSTDGDPTVCEIIALSGPIGKTSSSPQPRNGAFFTTATWLRGQYNTVPNSAGSAGQLAIGWWPRYPSALPTTPSAEHFRSRAFSWASFPFALYGARFDQGLLTAIGGPSLARVAVQGTATDDLFAIEARASGASRAVPVALPTWSALTPSPLANANAGGDADASAAFDHGEFSGAVDGAELRVTWHYRIAPSPFLENIANAANRAPMLGAVRIRALAPSTVLAVEDAR